MTSEYGLVKSLLEQTKEEPVRGLLFTEGHIGGVEVVLAKCGIGKVCAAVGTMEMIQRYYCQYRGSGRDRSFDTSDGYCCGREYGLS